VLDTMDEQLGVLFDFVRNNQQLRDNTLILVCSDNGPEQGAGSAGPFRGFKTHLFEGGIRSSLIAWGPGLVKKDRVGTTNTASWFSAIDLVPSILAITDIQCAAEFDGEQLSDVLLGNSNASREKPIFFRRPPDRDAFYGVDDCPDLAVRDGDWKLLCEYDGADAMLYDLENDRGETNNVAVENPDVVDRLTNSLVEWHNSMPPDNGATFRTKPRKPKK
jgi:arylsulfatase A-like enzyme